MCSALLSMIRFGNVVCVSFAVREVCLQLAMSLHQHFINSVQDARTFSPLVYFAVCRILPSYRPLCAAPSASGRSRLRLSTTGSAAVQRLFTNQVGRPGFFSRRHENLDFVSANSEIDFTAKLLNVSSLITPRVLRPHQCIHR